MMKNRTAKKTNNKKNTNQKTPKKKSTNPKKKVSFAKNNDISVFWKFQFFFLSIALARKFSSAFNNMNCGWQKKKIQQKKINNHFSLSLSLSISPLWDCSLSLSQANFTIEIHSFFSFVCKKHCGCNNNNTKWMNEKKNFEMNFLHLIYTWGEKSKKGDKFEIVVFLFDYHFIDVVVVVVGFLRKKKFFNEFFLS